MEAQEWVRRNIPDGRSIESTPYTPAWNKLSGVSLDDTRAPFFSGRERYYQEVLPDNTWAEAHHAEETDGVQWYAIEQLLKRDPDYIALDSLYYGRFTLDESPKSQLYPSLHEYFSGLLHEEYPYRIVFDQETQDVPRWIYPREIDALHNRMVILQRE
jgi:hypothetical protein